MSRVVLQILERYSTDKEYELQKSHDKNPFHTLRYDFKPASVNSDEPASLELSSKGEVTIKAPNIAGSSSSHTVFRGQRRPHVKECLLVIDNRTGEMVLQKLTDNITVKATRTLGGNGAGNTSTSNPQATAAAAATTITTPQQHNSTPNPAGNGNAIKTSNHLHNNHANSSNNNTSLSQNSNNHTANSTADGPQLSEESSSSSDDDSADDDDDSADDSSDSGSSSSSSSSGSNDEGFTF